MDFKLPTSTKPALLGALGGAIGISVLAISTGWAVTGNNALELAEKRESAALAAALTPICVAQFEMQVQDIQTTKLAALAEQNRWKRDAYVEDQGWATMPGSAEPDETISEACATELLAKHGS